MCLPERSVRAFARAHMFSNRGAAKVQRALPHYHAQDVHVDRRHPEGYGAGERRWPHHARRGVHVVAGLPLSWILGPGTPEKVSNTLLLDMAGNAFSSSMFGSVYLAMLAELPPIDELPANTAGDDVESSVESMFSQ